MDITYLGHSSFKLRGKTGTVVTDPYDQNTGLKFPNTSADIVTVSHSHHDHNAVDQVSGTARREKPFVIAAPGEYELAEISLFGHSTFHDDQQGQLRGMNTVMVIHLDGVTIAHLGDLGHPLSDKQLAQLGVIDVLLIPVGGVFTITAKQASEVIEAIEPSIAIPMHYRTPQHSESFKELTGVEEFLKEMGKEGLEPQEKLSVTPDSLPGELEIVVLKP